jgi:DNA primase large subunit
MERRHARYPFLESAREAVEAEGVDIAAVIADDGPGGNPVVERATERVVNAVHGGAVGPPHRRERVELVSYPVARALVSALDRSALTERYAAAEAATARERFGADTDPDTVSPLSLSRGAFLSEFGLAEDVTEREDGYEVAVGPYLELAGGLEGTEWRLVNRLLAEGTVPVEGGELDALLEQAVRRRVAAGLPLSVPEPVVEALAGPIETVERELADYSPRRDIDTVVPGLFPPCVRALLDRAKEGEDLPPRSAFALASFLTSIGLSADGARTLSGLDDGLDPFPEAYPPPSCETMAEQGDCVNKDERCAGVPTPLAYYEDALDDAGTTGDWREA